jgi:hypothetical protein
MNSNGSGNGALYYNVYNDATWGPQIELSGDCIMSYSPSPVVFNGELYVFFNGPDENGAIMYTTSSDGSNWSGTTPSTTSQVSGAKCSYTPWPVVYNGQLWVFYQAQKQEAAMWYSVLGNDGAWGGSTEVPNFAVIYGDNAYACGGLIPPVAVVFNGTLYLFYIATNWTIAYSQYLGGTGAEAWSTPILITSSNSGTANFTPVVYDNDSGVSTLAIYFQGYSANGLLYYVCTTDPSSASNWSEVVQAGAPLPSTQPPGVVGEMASLVVSVIQMIPSSA